MSNMDPMQNRPPGPPPMPGQPPMQGGMPPMQGGMPPMGQLPNGGLPAGAKDTGPEAIPETPFIERVGPPKELEDLHIDELLNIIVDRNCSDLHISANSEPIIREDGTLFKLNYQKFTPQQSQRMLYEIISDDNVNKFETNYELDFSYSLPKGRARFRVNLYKDRGAVAAAFRLIASKIPTVEQLNLPLLLNTLVEKPRGLILVTGPTGSGKSTSLAAMINKINSTKPHHIITIEDPIEYLHVHKMSLINQRELGQDTKSFNNALRASLREDPDVILVGEMRDLETVALAITAAETGHLVFATLHTNTAAESIDRMIDVFPPGQQEQIRIQLANNIVAVIAQQLLPRANGPGRIPVNEIMVASPAIRNLIRENKTHQITSMIQTSAALGMITMDQRLRDLYMQGVITLDDAMTRCVNPEELKKMIATPQGGPGGPSAGGPPGRR